MLLAQQEKKISRYLRMSSKVYKLNWPILGKAPATSGPQLRRLLATGHLLSRIKQSELRQAYRIVEIGRQRSEHSRNQPRVTGSPCQCRPSSCFMKIVASP